MNCTKCGRIVDNNLVACPYCAVQKNDVAIRRYQYDPLLKIAAGHGMLTIHPTPTGRHAQMYGTDQCKGGPTAFCGEPASAARHKRTHIPWGGEEMNRICTKCRIEMQAILEEAREAQAIQKEQQIG
jgi:hypothetical protein